MPLGRTNTEHYTLSPVYGTNIHQPQHGRKVGQECDPVPACRL
jgi:hypothetical protein